MTTDSGKKPLIGHFEVWGTDECMNDNCTGRITLFVANKKCISCDPESYTKESVQIPPCANCERLEGEKKEYRHEAYVRQKINKQLDAENEKLKAQLAMCKEALKLIALDNIYVGENGWKDEYFLNVKQAKEALAKLEKE